jgi:xanthosine utilization system XapX-like protein
MDKYKYHLSLLLAGFCYSFLEVFSVVLSKMQVPVFNMVGILGIIISVALV